MKKNLEPDMLQSSPVCAPCAEHVRKYAKDQNEESIQGREIHYFSSLLPDVNQSESAICGQEQRTLITNRYSTYFRGEEHSGHRDRNGTHADTVKSNVAALMRKVVKLTST